MPGLIRVGTSGWSYPTGRGTWNGVFYPARRGRGFDDLAYYAEHFDTVEVNSTFYRMPEAALTARWIARTPPGFEFAVKLFQKFTHPDMFLGRTGAKDWDLSSGDLDLFRAGIDPIARAGRLGALLMQFPPAFHAMAETRDYLAWLMRAFAAYPIAVEFRHQSWTGDAADTAALIASGAATWVLTDDPFVHVDAHPTLALAAPGAAPPSSPLSYARLHGRNKAEWWTHEAPEDRYNYLYSSAQLRPIADIASRAAARGQKVLMYLNNHFSAKAVVNAVDLKNQLGQLLPGDYPAEMIEHYPDLIGVVRSPPSLL